jgi:hypothetical protein
MDQIFAAQHHGLLRRFAPRNDERRASGFARQVALHVDRIEPAPELISNIAHPSGMDKPALGMERDRGWLSPPITAIICSNPQSRAASTKAPSNRVPIPPPRASSAM